MPRETSGRPLDLICFGRAAVDLYAEQLGARLEDVSSFQKYIGGCAANIAVGTARQGLKSSMLTRVGDDHMGRFVRETLQREGVDTGHVSTDPQRLTGLVLLGIKDRDTFPLIFYRENCADMALAEGDFDAGYIGSAKALLVTGTHFSTESINQVSHRAIQLARQAGTKVILDIDYRPVLWGLTGPGAGAQRFVASDRVTAHLQEILPRFDLVVGTVDGRPVYGGTPDDRSVVQLIAALKARGLKVTFYPFVMMDVAAGNSLPVEVNNVAFEGNFINVHLTDAHGGARIVQMRNDSSIAVPSPGKKLHLVFAAENAVILADGAGQKGNGAAPADADMAREVSNA